MTHFRTKLPVILDDSELNDNDIRNRLEVEESNIDHHQLPRRRQLNGTNDVDMRSTFDDELFLNHLRRLKTI
jgi:hypothetical protein